ncbi:pantoate--beta-alanine ligase [Buchnera aphidicola]|uniref:Pantothenate synthetase n=1 Tax=Buchnera aphidicola str. USDA (Myzus persicae) TaxID=1009856 RepID=W0P0A8_BUCMP|nr:pantoate--beta-alanine ligase [Buchnera aphidicola]AHG60176.1 Panc [Buchnera aphidicola str. USDA (Myzus persicae)]AHG61327.1 Panc [Buchnera aphidicola str. G002 (Myzus persicae)]AHG61900.1 Panc [Buchnera aphidicola str. F009 (Myzus persicae)]WAI03133.1 MAG: pantoate--beta-alanine ligase [Buchnera aphidicola (Myzus persicae)]
MNIIKNLKTLHAEIKFLKKINKKIGLIPTMGNLHDGHIKLILLAKKYSDIVIVSIFINPMQFNNLLDLEKYPRSFDQDCMILKNNKVDILFFPTINEIYPSGIENQTFITVPKLSNIVEGKARPGHFQGVTTVIAKLFNVIQPNFSFFGEKDYQQLLIIKKLVKELNYMIKIISLPTIRSKNGLALSSRNNNLNSQEIKTAPYLYSIIKKTAKQVIKEDSDIIINIINSSRTLLFKKGFSIDIFNIYDYQTLDVLFKKKKKMIILASVWLGQTRLIDNKKIFID